VSSFTSISPRKEPDVSTASPLRLVLIALLITVVTSSIVAQVTQRDVIYLKNGSVIKGAVLEQIPDKTVKIQTADGSIFVFQMSEVERITKEGVPPPTTTVAETVAEPERRSGFFSFVAGGAMPVGVFAKTDDPEAGLAKFGFIAGAEYSNISAGGIYFAIGGSFIINDVDKEAALKMFGGLGGMTADISSWKMIVPSISLGFGTTSSGTRVFVAGDFGYAICSSPEMKIEYMGMSFNQASEKGNAPAFGGRVGVQTSGGVTFMVRYLAMTPKYKVDVSGTGGTPTEAEQKQSVVLFTLGIGL
jgi:hypothetical protein